MKERSTITAGLCAGGVLSSSFLALQVPPAVIALGSVGILFAFTTCSLMLCSALGWPQKSSHTLDLYDLNKFVIAFGAAGLIISFLFAATIKLSNVLAVSGIVSLGIALSVLAAYIALGSLLYTFVRYR